MTMYPINREQARVLAVQIVHSLQASDARVDELLELACREANLEVLYRNSPNGSDHARYCFTLVDAAQQHTSIIVEALIKKHNKHRPLLPLQQTILSVAEIASKDRGSKEAFQEQVRAIAEELLTEEEVKLLMQDIS